jgi:hypothetical protein
MPNQQSSDFTRVAALPASTSDKSAVNQMMLMAGPAGKGSSPRKPVPPGGGAKRPDRGQSTNLFWFLMIALVVAIIAFGFSTSWRPKTMTYSDFKSKVASGALGAQIHDLSKRAQDE